MDLTELTLSKASDLIKKRHISPRELTDAYLERIQQLDSQLNCFITLTAQSDLEQARESEALLMRGGYRGPLHGIPLALKDLYETAGVRTTAGSTFFTDHIPAADAAAVQKLKASGAILLGKLNMHEIALGVTNENPHFGDCCNPHDVERITGGSSGGSAAALAAHLCSGSLGSDTGGSIRIPASLCGIVGLKPTRGRVSLRGVIPLSWNLDHAGPMARCVKDTAMLLQSIAGYDPLDPMSIDRPVDDCLNGLEAGVRGMRIALASDEYFTNLEVIEPEVLNAVQEAARTFTALGCTVDPVDFQGMREAAQANGLMTTSDAAAFHRERLKNYPEKFGEDIRLRLQTGAAYTSTEYILARRTQTVMIRQLEELFAKYDILMMPTTPITAPLRHSQDAVARAPLLTRFTAPFNLTGFPAISIPCGKNSRGMPIGLQLVSRPWFEADLLRAAYAYENRA